MPEIGIEDVLIEVDQQCQFTREFTALGTYAPRVDNFYPALLASLLAQGTNVGIAQMAQAARIRQTPFITSHNGFFETRRFVVPIVCL